MIIRLVQNSFAMDEGISFEDLQNAIIIYMKNLYLPKFYSSHFSTGS